MRRRSKGIDAAERDRHIEIARTIAGYSLAGEIDADAERAALADMAAAELRAWCERRADSPSARIALDHLDQAEEAAAA